MNIHKISNNILIFYFLIFFSIELESKEVQIVTKIDNDIITNIDILDEYNYLITLNTNLKNIEKKDLLDFAKKSLIKEKIKEKEVLKIFELDKKNKVVDDMIQNIYKNLNLNSENQFREYLNNNFVNYDDVYRKISIESAWNQMIYEKYRDKIIIDENKLKEKILKNKKKTVSYFLSELVFDFKNKEDIKKKYSEIKKSIQESGFEKSVIKYSISDSKNNSGIVGWINKNTLNEKIQKAIEKIGIGEISDPIIMPSGAIILKLSDKKIVDADINLEKELQKLIEINLNNQLNNYSAIYYNKIKNNFSINEY